MLGSPVLDGVGIATDQRRFPNAMTDEGYRFMTEMTQAANKRQPFESRDFQVTWPVNP
jgi:hypothetical protein